REDERSLDLHERLLGAPARLARREARGAEHGIERFELHLEGPGELAREELAAPPEHHGGEEAVLAPALVEPLHALGPALEARPRLAVRDERPHDLGRDDRAHPLEDLAGHLLF